MRVRGERTHIQYSFVNRLLVVNLLSCPSLSDCNAVQCSQSKPSSLVNRIVMRISRCITTQHRYGPPLTASVPHHYQHSSHPAPTSKPSA